MSQQHNSTNVYSHWFKCQQPMFDHTLRTCCCPAPQTSFTSWKCSSIAQRAATASKMFRKGAAENTTSQILERVRGEVHVSNGKELGPTTPADLGPGEKRDVKLTATSRDFNGWTAHPELGSSEHGHGGEHDGEGETYLRENIAAGCQAYRKPVGRAFDC